MFFWLRVAALAAAVLVTLPWETQLSYKFDRDRTKLESELDIDDPAYKRRTVMLDGPGGHDDDKIEAWVYTPVLEEGAAPPPVVVLAHGLGAQKDMALHPYAEQFAKAGLASVVFDYRFFGGSDGEPRHVVDWREQLKDWESVVRDIRAGVLGAQVDPTRVGLWGASYSGAHVLVTAAKMGDNVTAVVANEPYLDAKEFLSRQIMERGLFKSLRLLLIALHDLARGLLHPHIQPAYIRTLAVKGELGILEISEDEWERTHKGKPPRRIGGWQGKIAARLMLINALYHPFEHVHKIRVPTLLVGGTYDEICPMNLVHKVAEKIGDHATVLEKPYGHFQLHNTGHEPEELAPIIQFYREKLGMAPLNLNGKLGMAPLNLNGKLGAT